jgi:regulator of replication initiation timing
MKTNVLTQIKQLLGMEVKLEMMKLADGMTIIEADSFDPEMAVVIVTEDEQKIPLPVGEYELEDGRILVVAVEGIIAEIKEAPAAEEEAPMEQPEAEVPVEAEAEVEVTNPKKTVESIIKETFFSEMEALKLENEELKAKLETFSKVEPTTEVTTEEATEKVELEEVKPITFNPEKENKVEGFKFATKKGASTMDSVLAKMYK